MSTIAFALLAAMLAAYTLLDGYDLGIAAITPLVARTSEQRAASMHAIGPFWNGNEVWLIAAGATLFALFPKAYASAFSGFYLPFMVVLWMLMFRGIAMELRGHFPSAIWRDFWDFCFTGSSALLILLFGITLGNLLRGLPLDADGYFTGTFGFLLNPFSLLVGVLALLTLAAHGACFLMLRVDGMPAARARALLPLLILATFVLYVGLTIAVLDTIGLHTTAILWMLDPLVAIAALAAMFFAVLGGYARRAFAASCAFLLALLGGAALAMYPYVLPGFPQRTAGLSAAASSPSPVALGTALTVSVAGLCAVIVYSTYVARSMREKIRV